MCLYIKKNQEAQIAKRAIVCYKLVEVSIEEPIYYRSWVQLVTVQLGEEYMSILVKEEGDFSDSISEGLHSYTSLEKAKFELRVSHCYFEFNSAIVKCIIPKGSTYYKNDDGQFASDRIIYGTETIEL
jgi:hypothetical protein